MPEHIITLADHEARRLAEAGVLFLVRPVVPQPRPLEPDGWVWEPFEYYDDAQMRERLLAAANPLGIPGDVLVCKERWGDIRDGDCLGHTPFADKRKHIIYAADCSPGGYEDCLREEAGIKWRPAPTMPRWAARFRPVVIEAGVMQVENITGTDAEAMGLDVAAKLPAFPPMGVDTDALVDVVGKQVLAAYWNRRFRKYPWESNPWCWWARVEREDDHA